MEVILLEKVENLGNLGDRVKVRAGYGRNFLIPTGRATAATPENVVKFEARRAELEKIAAEALKAAQARCQALEGMAAVTIKANAGEEGRLFGSVGVADIAQALTDAGVKVERHEVRLPSGPFRQVGEYEVDIHLGADADARVKVTIIPE